MKKKLLIGMSMLLAVLGISMLLAVLILRGCGYQDRPVEKVTLSDLENWFDDQGFDEKSSELSMRSFVESLLFQGQPLEFVYGNWDGAGGGGSDTSTKAKDVGYETVYWSEEGSDTAYYDVTFYTRLNLDNFKLPGSLLFGDSFERVMKTLKLKDIDPRKEFVADKEGGSSMTLIEEGDASLVFSKLKVGGNNLFPYKLQYSLNTKSKDGENTVIKTIKFFFFDDLLTEFRVSTTEYFPK